MSVKVPTETRSVATQDRVLAGAQLKPVRLEKLPDQPLVSVLMANYNYGSFIAEAIESVLDQTYPQIELIICDDGSTDDSCDVVEQYARRDTRVKLIRLQQNSGMAAAANAAYAASSGEIICLLDSDDTYTPSKVEEVVNHFLARPQVGMVIHRILVVDQFNRGIQELPFLTRFEHGWIADRVLRRGGRWRDMPTGALCFRRELAGYVYPIPEATFRRAADGFIFTLLPLLTEVSAIDHVLSNYRIHGRNIYADRRLTRRKAMKQIESIKKQVDAVNERLLKLGFSGVAIDVNNNLVYQQRKLMCSLHEGLPRLSLLGAYAALLPALLADDLYGLPQKLLGVLVYGVAIPLPMTLRSKWIGVVFDHSRVKLRLQKILKRGRAGLGRSMSRSAETSKPDVPRSSGAHQLGDTYITSRDLERTCTVHMLGQVEQLLASLNGHLDGNQRLLDVGCGFGGLPAAIGRYLNIEEIYGVDVDPTILSEATAKGVRATQCEVGREPLPYPTEHFDLVTSFGMLDYLPHYDDALRELFRVTKPGGLVIVSLPNLASWHNRLFLLLGYQPRDIEISKEILVGCAPHYNREPAPVGHLHIPTTIAFRELMEHVGFRTIIMRGARPTADPLPTVADWVDRMLTKSPNLARRFFYVGQKPKL